MFSGIFDFLPQFWRGLCGAPGQPLCLDAPMRGHSYLDLAREAAVAVTKAKDAPARLAALEALETPFGYLEILAHGYGVLAHPVAITGRFMVEADESQWRIVIPKLRELLPHTRASDPARQEICGLLHDAGLRCRPDDPAAAFALFQAVYTMVGMGRKTEASRRALFKSAMAHMKDCAQRAKLPDRAHVINAAHIAARQFDHPAYGGVFAKDVDSKAARARARAFLERMLQNGGETRTLCIPVQAAESERFVRHMGALRSRLKRQGGPASGPALQIPPA